MQITDRAKDVIKSGGEWISSIEIENIAAGHPKAAMRRRGRHAPPQMGRAAAAAWCSSNPARTRTRDEFTETSWKARSPSGGRRTTVVFVDAIPLGATGKIDKKALRARHAERPPQAAEAG